MELNHLVQTLGPVMLLLSAVVFVVLMFINAPYGRHHTGGWGKTIPAKFGWMVMEAPAALIVFVIVMMSDPICINAFGFMLLWQVHYFYRAFIYPFTLSSAKAMPIVVVLLGFLFNCVNGVLIGHGLVNLPPLAALPILLLGGALFIGGMILTRYSDGVLKRLRQESAGYGVPQGGAYRFVSCPNYSGEIVQWFGWLVMTQNLAAVIFLCWTVANLLPRALANHRWYQQKFSDYPAERKAIIPYLL